MSVITATMVKALRDETGAGISNCKSALLKANGDIQKAKEVLKEMGLKAATKKLDRVATEGTVIASVSSDKKNGIIIEINSETDFLAMSEKFKIFTDSVVKEIFDSNINSIEEILKNKVIDELIKINISITGEKLSVRRFERINANEDEVLINYNHSNKIAVLLLLKASESEKVFELGKNICMQIASMDPKFVSRDQVESKDMDVDNKDLYLLEQEYIKDNSLNVGEYIKENNNDIAIVKFVRFKIGEGLAKKHDNFVEEVNSMTKKASN